MRILVHDLADENGPGDGAAALLQLPGWAEICNGSESS